MNNNFLVFLFRILSQKKKIRTIRKTRTRRRTKTRRTRTRKTTRMTRRTKRKRRTRRIKNRVFHTYLEKKDKQPITF